MTPKNINVGPKLSHARSMADGLPWPFPSGKPWHHFVGYGCRAGPRMPTTFGSAGPDHLSNRENFLSSSGRPGMARDHFCDRFFLRIISTYIPDANPAFAAVGHHPHQKRECHKHQHSQQHSIREVRGPARTRATYNTSEGRQRVSPHTPRPSGLDPANSGHRRYAQAKSSVHPSSVSFSMRGWNTQKQQLCALS